MEFDLNTILLILAAVFALPGGLFTAALVTARRGRWLSFLGGFLGDLVFAVSVYYIVVTTTPSLDGLSFFLGAFFGCSIGVAAGAMIASFLLGLGDHGPDVSANE